MRDFQRDEDLAEALNNDEILKLLFKCSVLRQSELIRNFGYDIPIAIVDELIRLENRKESV